MTATYLEVAALPPTVTKMSHHVFLRQWPIQNIVVSLYTFPIAPRPTPKHSEHWVTMLSSAGSSSSVLLTHLPPGAATGDFNLTVVAHVSDNLGSMAVTSLGVDGMPLAILSKPPEQVLWVVYVGAGNVVCLCHGIAPGLKY